MLVGIGQSVTVDGRPHVVTAIRSGMVVLRDVESGFPVQYALTELVRDPDVVLEPRIAGAVVSLPVALDELSARQRTDLAFWSEVIGALVRELDAAERGERAQVYARAVARVAADGRSVSVRSLRRKAADYRSKGRAALIDTRLETVDGRDRRWDPRLVEAMLETMTAETDQASGTVSRLIWRTLRRVEATHGPGVVPVPSQPTLYRMVRELDPYRLSTGSAVRRRQTANTPDHPHAAHPAFAPGEQVQIDSTPLDVRVRLADGVSVRPELTILLDVATRSILAAVIRPISTKSTDLILALARALVPFDRRPGDAHHTRHLVADSFAVPLMPQAEFDEYRRRVPLITPRLFVTDLGRVFTSAHFLAACEQLGISVVRASPRTPTDKGKVERTFRSINTLFTQYVAGYVGRNVENRGAKDPEELFTLQQLQELLDQWVVVEWQNRRHKGLRDPIDPTVIASPNEMADAFRALMPGVEIPFDGETYVRLLPVLWRRVRNYGITIHNRTYDSPELRPLRGRRSRHASHNGKWPVRWDPYNIQTVWLEHENQLIPLRWVGASALGPMSGDVWKVARAHRDPRRGAVEETARMRRLGTMRDASQHVIPPRTLARSDAAQSEIDRHTPPHATHPATPEPPTPDTTAVPDELPASPDSVTGPETPGSADRPGAPEAWPLMGEDE